MPGLPLVGACQPCENGYHSICMGADARCLCGCLQSAQWMTYAANLGDRELYRRPRVW